MPKINFRVLGVNRLRVVDGSVMPHITNANPNSVVVAIAEKTALEILRLYKNTNLKV